MIWLALDGALGAFSAALVADDGAFAPRAAAAHGHDALERGLGIVDEVLGGTPLSEVGALAVGTGPGTFTGLRIALAYAKSLAFARGLPLHGVSSYDALEPAGIAGAHATFVHGRVGIACARLRLPGANGTWAEVRVCGTYDAVAGEIARHVSAPTVLVAYGASQGAAPALGERGIIVHAQVPASSVAALAVARRAILADAGTTPHAVVADYGEAHYAERGTRS